jgi:hypothetical protein
MISGDDHGQESRRIDRRRVAVYLSATPFFFNDPTQS